MSVVQPILKICPDYVDSLHCGTGRFTYILCSLASVREDRRENPMFCPQIAKLLSCLPLFPLSFCNYGQQMIIFIRNCFFRQKTFFFSSRKHRKLQLQRFFEKELNQLNRLSTSRCGIKESLNSVFSLSVQPRKRTGYIRYLDLSIGKRSEMIIFGPLLTTFEV